MHMRNQAGFSFVGVLLVLIVVSAIGFAGYRVWQSRGSEALEATNAASSFPAAIENKADLTQTSHALDDMNTQLESGLDASALDADLNSLL
jgi:hypothetical protein